MYSTLIYFISLFYLVFTLIFLFFILIIFYCCIYFFILFLLLYLFFIIIVIILTSLFKHPVGLSAFPCQWLIVGHGRQCYCVRCFSLFFSVHVYCCTSNILCCFIVFIIFFFKVFPFSQSIFNLPFVLSPTLCIIFI